MLDAVKRTDALNSKFRTHLRFVEPSDAAYICELRSNARLNRFLSASSPDMEEQRQWIEDYKSRERTGEEYYFVLVSDAQDRGLIRIYDYCEIGGLRSFQWGSWVIAPPRIPGLALFSAFMMYEIGFDTLGFERAHLRVVKENIGVRALHERTGAELESEDEQYVYLRYMPESYAAFRTELADQIRKHRAVASTPATASA